MIFRTVVRDCLYLNWALPVGDLSPPPPPLRYDRRESEAGGTVFASALLFRQEGLHWSVAPYPRITYPQFHLHLCTVDEEGVPSVWIRAVLLPGWMVPGARLLAGQPAKSARLDFPSLVTEVDRGQWHWEVRRGTRFLVEAEPGGLGLEQEPRLGTWEETVSYFRRRSLGYYASLRGLRRVEVKRQKLDVVPIRARIEDSRLLENCLPELQLEEWPAVHSAWLCPPMSAAFEFGQAEKTAVGSRVPAPG
jgi:hypothetical protein